MWYDIDSSADVSMKYRDTTCRAYILCHATRFRTLLIELLTSKHIFLLKIYF